MTSLSSKKKKVGIIGATGYTGRELVRLLQDHPHVEVSLVVGHSTSGQALDVIHPELRFRGGDSSRTCLEIQSYENEFLPGLEHGLNPTLEDLDILFLALPHGQSGRTYPKLDQLFLKSKRPKLLIDLAQDFRIQADENLSSAGKQVQDHMEDGGLFVYGLSELFGSRIRESTRIANPGCFATGVILGMAPLVKGLALVGEVVVDGVTGSSGSGNKPTKTTHHPEREGSFFAYKPLAHQHLSEIVQALFQVQPSWQGRMVFQSHSGPFVRGIHLTIHGELSPGIGADEVGQMFEQMYAKSPMIRLLREPPQLRWVLGTNGVDISWVVRGCDVVVYVTLDNLVKGASGQGIQNMNLAMGWDETCGLGQNAL